MQVIPCMVRGEPRWKIETFAGGKRKRQFFRSEPEAIAGLKAAQKDRAAFGKAWAILTAREKSDLMFTLDEIKRAGWTLAEVWNIAKGQPKAKKDCWSLRRTIDETIVAKRKLNRREGYIDGLEAYLNMFAKGREFAPIADFGVAEIAAWFDARNEAPTTRNSNLGRLSAMFDIAWRRGQIRENPCKKVEKSSVDEGRPSTLTLNQYGKALAWCIRKQPRFLAWFVLALFVGLRPEAEADNLDWEKIDLRKGTIRIDGDSTKVRRPRLIYLSLSPPALEWLRVAKAMGCPLDMSFSTRRRYLRGLRDFLGFEKWPQDILRHTAASNLLAFHQDAGKVAKFLGNSPATLLKDYADQLLEREEAERFMKLLPSWLRKIRVGIYRIT
ncbi:MAG TPA: hypothetical protein VFB72_15950 [Verrucomicrobiae bacterium]|nr:hypothetical protein [Verrucomicrobiae bacterium]